MIAALGLLIPIVVIALAVVGVRRLAAGGSSVANRTLLVRQFFQYLVLLVLLIISAVGLSGLATRLLSIGQDVTSDPVALARDVSFSVVGLPVVIALTIWTRREFKRDAQEAQSFAFGLLMTAASTTTLITSMVASYNVLTWATNLTTDWREPVARLLVWGTAWLTLVTVRSSYSNTEQQQAMDLSGSLVGLGTAVAGFVAVIGGLIQLAVSMNADLLISPGTDPVLRGIITASLGAVAWSWHWIGGGLRSQRNTLWLAYVMLAGIAGGLVATIVSLSSALYQTLVWFFGTPVSTDAYTHFSSLPVNAGYVVVGLTTWWYHQSVLRDGRKELRTEVTRVYEYLMSGIALIAVTTGIGILVVALIEAVTGTNLVTNGNATNTLLLSITLLVVATPAWWVFWNRIQTLVAKNPEAEVSSPTRRGYLYLLFGVGGIAAIGSLITGIFQLFTDIFQSEFSSDTFRSMRSAIGVLLTTGTVAIYHLMVYRAERKFAHVPLRGSRNIILVGPKDPGLVQEISERTGDRVRVLVAAESDSMTWSHSDVLNMVEQQANQDLVIVMNAHGLEVIPVVNA